MYSDPAYTIQVGSTISLALQENVDYRYSYAVQSSGTGSTSSATFTLGGFLPLGVTQSVSVTSSGGFVLGGTSITSRGSYKTGSGGLVLGGTSATSRSSSYIVASGGFVIGGTSAVSYNGNVSASYTGSGGFVLGGTSLVSRSSSVTGRGGLVLGGSSPYSFTLATNVQEIVYELYDSTGTPITGATTLTCLIRTTPGPNIYDWADGIFKPSGWTSISTALIEIDSVNLPGIYKKEIDVSLFESKRYQVFIKYTATQSQHGSVEFLVRNGQIVDEYTATSTAANYTAIGLLPNASDNATAVLTAATTTPISANVKKMNDASVTGTGVAGDLWRG
jgi:hypothetical protein